MTAFSRLLGTAILLALAPLAAAAKPIDAKPAEKWAEAKHLTGESLSSKIDGLVRAPIASSTAGTIMSPANATRVSIAVAGEAKTVTLIDAKSLAQIGQWTITSASTPAEVASISSAVRNGMGLESKPALPAKDTGSKDTEGK